MTGYHNLIKLISTAHLEGFYYKPRIDKELLAEHSEGLIGLSACLKGEVAAHLADDDVDGAMRGRRRVRRHPRARTTSSSKSRTTASPSSARPTRCMPSWPRKTGLPLVATNDVHYLQAGARRGPRGAALPADPDRHERPQAHALPHRPVLPEDPRGDGAALPRVPRGASTTRSTSPSAATSNSSSASCTSPPSTCPTGITQKQYLIELGQEGIRRLLRHRGPAPTRRTTARREIMDRFDHELGVIEKTGFINYFLVVWDFVRFAREQQHPGRARPRLRRRQPRRLRARHHRHRPAALRPDLRALPQPRARLAAGLRHRLLPGPARRGDRVREGEVRPRERGPDHHLRLAGRQDGDPRRRARAGDPLREVRPARQDDSRRSQDDAEEGARA